MTRSADHLIKRTWGRHEIRDVYTDFNTVTLQIVTDALFGFQASSPESSTVTGKADRPVMLHLAKIQSTSDANRQLQYEDRSLVWTITICIHAISRLFQSELIGSDMPESTLFDMQMQ